MTICYLLLSFSLKRLRNIFLHYTYCAVKFVMWWYLKLSLKLLFRDILRMICHIIFKRGCINFLKTTEQLAIYRYLCIASFKTCMKYNRWWQINPCTKYARIRVFTDPYSSTFSHISCSEFLVSFLKFFFCFFFSFLVTFNVMHEVVFSVRTSQKNMLKVSLTVLFYQRLNIHFTHITAILSPYRNQSVDLLNKSID